MTVFATPDFGYTLQNLWFNIFCVLSFGVLPRDNYVAGISGIVLTQLMHLLGKNYSYYSATGLKSRFLCFGHSDIFC